MRLVARLFELGIVSLALWVSPVNATELRECIDVKRVIRAMPLDQQLSKIRRELRQQIREWQRGNEYEGQADTACLIGLYMLAGHDKNSPIDEKSALDRYNAMEHFLNEYSRNKLRDVIEDVLRDAEDANPKERRDNYQNAMFFLSTLIEHTTGIAEQQVVESYPYGGIKDKVWCGAPAEVRLRIDKKRREITSLAKTEVDWTSLGESGFLKLKHDASNYYDQKYSRVCESAQMVTSAMMHDLRDEYKSKAKQLTRTFWRTKFEGVTPKVQRQWETIAWLNLPCDRGPNAKEIALGRRIQEVTNTLNEYAWHKEDAQNRYKESAELPQEIGQLGGLNCVAYAKAKKQELQSAVKMARSAHREKIKGALARYRMSFVSKRHSQTEKHLKSHKAYIVERFPREKLDCLDPQRDVLEYRNSAHDLVRALKKPKPPLKELLEIYQKSTGENESRFRRWAGECEVSMGEESRRELLYSGEAVKTKVAGRIADLWVLEKSSTSLADTVLLLQQHCSSFKLKNDTYCIALPELESVQDLVRLNEVPESQVGRARLAEFSKKYGHVKDLLGHPRLTDIQERQQLIERRIKQHDDLIADYWIKLFKNCNTLESGAIGIDSNSASDINKFCSKPDHNELAHLTTFCRLQRLQGYTKTGSSNEELSISGGEHDQEQEQDQEQDHEQDNNPTYGSGFRLISPITSNMRNAGYLQVEEHISDLKRFKPRKTNAIVDRRVNACGRKQKEKIYKAVRSPIETYNHYFQSVAEGRRDLRRDGKYSPIYEEVWSRMVENRPNGHNTVRESSVSSAAKPKPRPVEKGDTRLLVESESKCKVRQKFFWEGPVVYTFMDQDDSPEVPAIPETRRVRLWITPDVGGDYKAYSVRLSGLSDQKDGYRSFNDSCRVIENGTFSLNIAPQVLYEFVVWKKGNDAHKCYTIVGPEDWHRTRKSRTVYLKYTESDASDSDCFTEPQLPKRLPAGVPSNNNSVHLTIRSNVLGDRVYIDGKYKGSTRLDLNLPKGRHTIRIEKEGYRTHEERIDLKNALTVRATLEKAKPNNKDPSLNINISPSSRGELAPCYALIHIQSTITDGVKIQGSVRSFEKTFPVIKIQKRGKDPNGERYVKICDDGDDVLKTASDLEKCSEKDSESKRRWRRDDTLMFDDVKYEVGAIRTTEAGVEVHFRPMEFRQHVSDVIDKGMTKVHHQIVMYRNKSTCIVIE